MDIIKEVETIDIQFVLFKLKEVFYHFENISKEKYAKMLCMNPTTLRSYLNGFRRPTKKKAYYLLKKLNQLKASV